MGPNAANGAGPAQLPLRGRVVPEGIARLRSHGRRAGEPRLAFVTLVARVIRTSELGGIGIEIADLAAVERRVRFARPLAHAVVAAIAVGACSSGKCKGQSNCQKQMCVALHGDLLWCVRSDLRLAED